ncbi:MAG: type II secretion system protein [Fimbriimonas sp.]|nr:type II secretion system protein [Fimbriimonas sp.]
MRHAAFTLIELLVVIAIIAVLASILFPVFAQTKASAQKATCLSNIRQIVSASLLYANDYDDTSPGAVAGHGSVGLAGGWILFIRYPADDNAVPPGYIPEQGTLFPYIHDAGAYMCPSDPHARSGNTYAINACVTNRATPLAVGRSLSVFQAPSDLLYFVEEADSEGDQVTGGTDDGYYLYTLNKLSERHATGSNAGFVDGHAKFILPTVALSLGYVFGGPNLTSCP